MLNELIDCIRIRILSFIPSNELLGELGYLKNVNWLLPELNILILIVMVLLVGAFVRERNNKLRNLIVLSIVR